MTHGELTFAADRPADVRATPPWRQYRHHVRALRARIAALTATLPLPERPRVLDYGCADAPYRGLFPPDAEYVAADLPGNPHATLELARDGSVPEPDGSFDAVLSTQVLEHVTDPALHLAEAARVLKPGGHLLVTTHGVFVWHPDPGDYWRWTREGIVRAVEQAGLEVVHFEGIVGLVPTGLQLIGDAVRPHLGRPLRHIVQTLFEVLIALTDRLHSQGSRDLNAQVVAVVARRP